MRLRGRGIKPDFWADSKIGRMGIDVRLFYVGLWCVADDAGYFDWDPDEIGARLFPYDPPTERITNIEMWGRVLEAARRIVRRKCGHSFIPSIEEHQSFTGSRRS
jgi:hypothetical protein